MIGTKIQNLKSIVSKDLDLQELLKGSALTFGFKILGLISGFLTTFITVKIYGAAALGVVAIVFAVLHFGNILSRFGIDTAALKFIASKTGIKEVYQKSLFLIFTFSIIVAGALFLSANIIASEIFNKPFIAPYLKWSSLTIPFLSSMFLHKESLRAMKRISAFAFFNTSSINIFSLILLVALQFYSTEIYIPVVALIAAIIISALLSFLIWNNTKVSDPSQSATISYRAILSTGSSLFIGGLALYFSNWTAIFILGIYKSAAETGIFETAFKIAAVSSLALMAVNGISAPKFAEAYSAGNLPSLQKQVSQSTKLIFYFTIPVVLLIFIFPDFLLQLFDPSFTVAALALQILAFGFLINAMAGSVGVLLQMAGQQKLYMYSTLFAGIINLFLSLILIPENGITGAAIAGTASLILWNLIAIYFVYKKLKIISFFRPF